MGSKKTERNGIKFVYLSGDTPFEIGYEHGKLLKNEIKEIFEKLEAFLREKYGPVLGITLIKIIPLYSKTLKKRFSKDHLEEMRGISEGSGKKLEWIVFVNSLYEIGVFFHKFLGQNACSFFAAPWKNSKYVVSGKTTDVFSKTSVPKIFSKYRVVFVYDYKSKSQYITFSFPSCTIGDSVIFRDGSLLALNDGGWSHRKINFRNEPILGILKKCANNSKNTKDVLRNIKKLKTTKPYVYLVTDGTKNGSLMIETSNGEYNVKKFEKYLINTNHLKSKNLIKSYYTEGYKEKKSYTNTLKRYENIEKKIGKMSDLKSGIELLKIHEKTLDSNKGSVSNNGTIQGYVYFPKEKKVVVTNGKKTPVTLTGKWIELNTEDLFNEKK